MPSHSSWLLPKIKRRLRAVRELRLGERQVPQTGARPSVSFDWDVCRCCSRAIVPGLRHRCRKVVP